MKKIEEKIDKLINKILYLSPDYGNGYTYESYINLLEQALSVCNYIQSKKNEGTVTECNYYIIRKLISEFLNNRQISGRIDIKNKLNKLYGQLEEILENLPEIEAKEVEITDLNSLIKKLKIYKLDGKYLSLDTYQSEYELYVDMRKIILSSGSSYYKRIYVHNVAKKLSSVTNINLINENPELFYMVKLVTANQNNEFIKYMQYYYDVEYRFKRNEWKNNLLELKNLNKDLPSSSTYPIFQEKDKQNSLLESKNPQKELKKHRI